jgi:predicted lipoprotein
MSERESDFELEHIREQLKVAVAALEAIKKHKTELLARRAPGVDPAQASTTWRIASEALTAIKESIYD